MRTRIFLLIAALFTQLPLVFADANSAALDKADYFFRHGAYKDAVGYYEGIASKTPRRKDAVLDAHLGDCYRLLKNPEQAAA